MAHPGGGRVAKVLKLAAPERDPVAEGKVRRQALNRGDLAAWHPERRRRDVADVLAEASQGRVQALLPIKRQRMAASPFSFFRGAAGLMAYDLSLSAHTGIITQLCGDAHVQNLGAYEGLDGNLIFDINDFDETIRGPFEWDVKRMTTSILLAGHGAGVKDAGCQSAAAAFLDAYCDLIHTLSERPVLEVARYQVRHLGSTGPVAKILANAERASPLHSRDKLTKPAKGGRVFRSQPPLLRRVTGEERHAVLGCLPRYRESLLPERRHFFDQFRPVDVGFKVVGTGSVGLLDYCILLQGNGPDDPLFLQIKQEVASAYAPYLPNGRSHPVEAGQRVADGQRAMQLQSDPLLGWTRFGGKDFLVRQLNDHKAALDVTTLNGTALAEYARVCGEMLARGHARSGEVGVIAGYLGRGKAFTASMLQFASVYAVQTVKDWKRTVGSAR